MDGVVTEYPVEMGNPGKETIRKFIVNNYLKGSELTNLVDDSSFLEEGIIDSVGVMELVAFLETTFNFRVEDEEIIPENLDSVNKLTVYVQSKLANNKS
jgi:acyl carrier protein